MSIPQVFAAMKAAARAINASGGIQGRPIQVITCNNQLNPNNEVSCATNAIAAGAVAMVSNFIAFNPGGVEAALRTANTADLAVDGVAAQQYNGDNAFPLFFNAGLPTNCTAPSLAKIFKKKVRIAQVDNPFPGADLDAKVVAASAALQGGRSVKAVGRVSAGITTVDFSPIVTRVSNLGAKTVLELLVPSQVPSFITAAKAAGKTWDYCSTDPAPTAPQLIRLGSNFSNFYTATPFPPLSAASHYPELKLFIKQMKAEEASGDSDASLSPANYQTAALNAWLGMQVLDQVASSMKGAIDHKSFLAALKTAKVNLGVIPPINFARPIGGGSYPGVYAAKSYFEHWNPAKKQFELVPGSAVQKTFAVSGLG